MHAKVGRGEIRSLLDRWPELRDQITYVDRVRIRRKIQDVRSRRLVNCRFGGLRDTEWRNLSVWFETTGEVAWRGRTDGELFGSRFFERSCI